MYVSVGSSSSSYLFSRHFVSHSSLGLPLTQLQCPMQHSTAALHSPSAASLCSRGFQVSLCQRVVKLIVNVALQPLHPFLEPMPVFQAFLHVAGKPFCGMSREVISGHVHFHDAPRMGARNSCVCGLCSLSDNENRLAPKGRLVEGKGSV